MLLRRSRSGVVIEINPYGVLMARLGRLGSAAMHVEQVRELPADDWDGVSRELHALLPEHKTYVPGICGIFPPTRLLQREEVNPRKLAEPDYLPTVLANQYKIPSDKWRIALVSPFDGNPFDAEHPPIKDVLLCGEAMEELLVAQRRFLSLGVHPRRMEISSLPVLGGVQSYQAMVGDSQPAAVVEFDLHRTYVFILGKGGVHTPAPLEFGFGALVETARKELNIEDAGTARSRLLAGEAEIVARAPRLLRQLVRNLKPAIDYFELQTGQRVNDLYCTFLPPGLTWLARSLAASIEMQVLAVDCSAWLTALGITFASEVPDRLGPHWLSVFSLIAGLSPASHAKKTERV
ncbi:MAG TPA: hypothetical protein VLT83_10190 [Opitutaceae bacterium]|nr:hypothetical protein [Opitutaceae bacterium]